MERIRLGTATIGEAERRAINSVLNSGYVSPGTITKEFEEQVAAAHGKKYGIALNSGQSAIMVVLQAAKKIHGIGGVAVPAITYISSFSAIVQAGLEPILVDVDRDAQAQMQWHNIPDCCDAVLPCHLFGKANTPPNLWPLFTCEDACEAIYADGLGFGDAICLSFYPSHTITAGVGGMILTNDKELYFKCWQLVNHGRQDWDDYTTCHTLKERFQFSEIGYSLKFSDLNAALGLAQHDRRKEIVGKRRTNASFMVISLCNIAELILPEFTDHTFMMFPIVCKDDSRDGLEKALNDANIETRRMMPLTSQPIVQEICGIENMEKYPNANFINDHGLYIGCHQDLSQVDLQRIIKTIKEFYVP